MKCEDTHTSTGTSASRFAWFAALELSLATGCFQTTTAPIYTLAKATTQMLFLLK